MPNSGNTKTLILAGATGVVGQAVMKLALAHPQVGKVVALTRKPLPPQPKLLDQLIDFDQMPETAPWWENADAVICTLGTTIKIAKTAEAFRRVDLHYPAQLARIASLNGVHTFVLNSAMMANPKARGLYLRTKGEAEKAVVEAGFESVTLARPGLLDGNRSEKRPGEEFGLLVSRIAKPLLPKRMRSVPVENLARIMLECALRARPGVAVLESEVFQSTTLS
ncbi:MAG TPA: NAD(P)H-binding protein [Limnobacter sp.]|uniref:NAD(P)H-binding protein n=1 Tax=Limnobacter sp. TaxID=2003368 RepID=UPI002E307D65|nr:NAD(P)H-binding protein [Limnobacter sp.]HEX5486127.1 NAD(P)H-binding protein [Limnobacter sp.]